MRQMKMRWMRKFCNKKDVARVINSATSFFVVHVFRNQPRPALRIRNGKCTTKRVYNCRNSIPRYTHDVYCGYMWMKIKKRPLASLQIYWSGGVRGAEQTFPSARRHVGTRRSHASFVIALVASHAAFTEPARLRWKHTTYAKNRDLSTICMTSTPFARLRSRPHKVAFVER